MTLTTPVDTSGYMFRFSLLGILLSCKYDPVKDIPHTCPFIKSMQTNLFSSKMMKPTLTLIL